MWFHWKKIGLPCLMHIYVNEILPVKLPTVRMECNGRKYSGCWWWLSVSIPHIWLMWGTYDSCEEAVGCLFSKWACRWWTQEGWYGELTTVLYYLRNSKHHWGPSDLLVTDQSALKHVTCLRADWEVAKSQKVQSGVNYILYYTAPFRNPIYTDI